MNKVIAGFTVAGATGLLSLAMATSAQAYPDTTPSDSQVESNTVSSGTPAALPNTGGPNEPLLFGGAALVVAGGASIIVARRRQTS